MLPYYIDQTNSYTIRVNPEYTKDKSSNAISTEYILNIQDMYLLNSQTASLSGVEYNEFESILSFTASIDSAKVGSQYRADIIYVETLATGSQSETIWNGSIQVYKQQESTKNEYETQNTQYKTRESNNEYVILT
jgi:hypothetical protein